MMAPLILLAGCGSVCVDRNYVPSEQFVREVEQGLDVIGDNLVTGGYEQIGEVINRNGGDINSLFYIVDQLDGLSENSKSAVIARVRDKVSDDCSIEEVCRKIDSEFYDYCIQGKLNSFGY
jgi:hypothetical protein